MQQYRQFPRYRYRSTLLRIPSRLAALRVPLRGAPPPPSSGKLGLEHFGSLAPLLFTNPRVVLMNCVRTYTNASRARSTTRSGSTSLLRCSIGNNDCGSTRPSRATLLASTRSLLRLRRYVPSINRGLATSTSCPHPTTSSRTQAGWSPLPKSRARPIMPENMPLHPPASSAIVLPPASPPPAPKCSSCSIGLRGPLLRALWLLHRRVLLHRVLLQPFAQLRHARSGTTSLDSRCIWPPAFAGFVFCPLLV
jgi:hypothetical protein